MHDSWLFKVSYSKILQWQQNASSIGQIYGMHYLKIFITACGHGLIHLWWAFHRPSTPSLYTKQTSHGDITYTTGWMTSLMRPHTSCDDFIYDIAWWCHVRSHMMSLLTSHMMMSLITYFMSMDDIITYITWWHHFLYLSNARSPS